jgi:hypothetical protein
MFKATKNAYCWTLECNYNSSSKLNILENKRELEDNKIIVSENTLD